MFLILLLSGGIVGRFLIGNKPSQENIKETKVENSIEESTVSDNNEFALATRQ